MDMLNIWLPLIGGGIFFAIATGAWFAEHKLTGIWFGFSGVVCFVLLAALQIQEHVLLEKTVVPDSPERPWISVGDPIIASPLKFIPAGATITLRFPVKHTGGRNPALNVSFQSELIPMTPERSAPHLERDRFVKELKEKPDGLVFGERSMFQGESFVVEQNFFISKAQIDAAASLLAETGAPKTGFLPILVACAVYKLNPGGPRHYTCIVGDVHKHHPQMSGLSVPFDISAGDVPINQIETGQLYASYVD